MPLVKSEICHLLPHTGDMCLLDTVRQWSDEEIVCDTSSHRDPANPLRCGDRLAAVSGVEYAAQAIGVHGRLVARNDAKPTAGFLASLRELLYPLKFDSVADHFQTEAS